MKTKIFTVDGKEKGEIDLPSVFNTPYRPDIINRVFTAIFTHRLQPKGNYYLAGKDTSAEYIGRRDAFRHGINRGIARLPRTKPGGGGLGDVARVPQAKGGMRAHPPKVEKIIYKRVNKKEKELALRSAIASTAIIELIKRRHKVDLKTAPIVVEDKFQELNKTKDIEKALVSLGLGDDLERAKEKKIRAGKGKMRGRKYRKKTSVLLVTTSAKFNRIARNIPGVDAVLVKDLSVKDLAPGGQAGRLTVWTESAIKALGE